MGPVHDEPREPVREQLDKVEIFVYFKKSLMILLNPKQTEACLVKALLLTFAQSSSREGGIDSTFVIIFRMFIIMFVANYFIVF